MPSHAARARVAVLLIVSSLLAACNSTSPSPGGSASAAPASASASASASPSVTGSSSPSAGPSATSAPTATPVPTPVRTPAPTAAPPAASTKVKLALVTGGLTNPIGIVNAGDGSGRLFINERGGRLRVIEANGTLRAAPFVDLTGRIQEGGERGLLGVAFHPNFENNRRVFVHYSQIGDGATVVSELTAAANGNTADPASERILLRLPDELANHNGGQLAFGPDGYLYIGLGDGGGGGDPYGSGQDRQSLLGKVLRIDVNGAHAAGKEYAIPNSNPYASGGASPGSGLPEIWVYGLRNPWRFSFDRANGDLYIGDVGQGSWEEIDWQAANSAGGENYGWNAHEGNHCYSSACGSVNSVPPIAEYSHSLGCSVTGGYVYRGGQAALKGRYFFGDYCSGTIFSIAAGNGKKTPLAVLSSGKGISSFGEGENGELYLVDIHGGGLYRLLAD